MPKRISWKKGMRLSDELLRDADRCTARHIGQALLLAAGGRFGLIPSTSPFKLEAAVARDRIEVESLDCTGITRSGTLIDVHWDSRYTSTFDVKVPIPDNEQQRDYVLIITVDDNVWRDVDEGYCEPAYALRLLLPDSPLPDNALPLARVVKDFAWTVDTHEFVPPCLLLAAHPRYRQLCERALEVLRQATQAAAQTVGGRTPLATVVCLPTLQQQMICLDKTRDELSPMGLWSIVQQCVSTVLLAGRVDPNLVLENPESWDGSATAPYSVRNVSQRIDEALSLMAGFPAAVQRMATEPEPAPEPHKPKPAPRKKIDPPEQKGKWWDGKKI